ncbi:unnamed protein product [Auanema sp. JU1783]|nr:unnamed protein product [Auanema sp. JU1783]
MSIILIMGIPAAGKSSLISELRQTRDCHIFSWDHLVGHKVQQFEAHKARKQFENQIRQFLETIESKPIVLIEDNFYLQSMRRPFERMARKYGLSYMVVHLSCALDEALTRNSRRDDLERVDKESIRKIYKEIEVPDDAYLFTTIEDLNKQIDQLNELSKTLVASRDVPSSQEGASPPSTLALFEKSVRQLIGDLVKEGYDGRRLSVAKKLVMEEVRKMSDQQALSVDFSRDLLFQYYWCVLVGRSLWTERVLQSFL